MIGFPESIRFCKFDFSMDIWFLWRFSPYREDRIGKTGHGFVDYFFNARGGFVAAALKNPGILRIRSRFGKQPADGCGPHVSPIIPLRKFALSFRAGNDENTPDAALNGMHHILGVDFSAARDEFDANKRSGTIPLGGERSAVGKAVFANVYRRFVHEFRFLCSSTRLFSFLVPDNIVFAVNWP
jgi:hypothetical protein